MSGPAARGPRDYRGPRQRNALIGAAMLAVAVNEVGWRHHATEVETTIPECARCVNVELRIAGAWQFGSERFDPGCIRLVREAAQGLDVRHRDLLSQSGHDAYSISRIAPAAMIFRPCRDGISHHEAEHADRDTTVPGVNVLLHAVVPGPTSLLDAGGPGSS